MKKITTILFLIGLVLFSACKKDENDTTNPAGKHDDEELITTVVLTITKLESLEDPIQYIFRDVDGVGGNPPSRFDTIILENSWDYDVSIELLNEAVTPTDTVTHTIREAALDHLICFSYNQDLLSHKITDYDDNDLPIGLESSWYVHLIPDTVEDFITISLKHQVGIKNGEDCDLGSTDIELTFPVKFLGGAVN